MQGLKKFKQVPDLQGQSGVSIAINDDYASKQRGGIVNSRKHRRSRWDPQPEGDGHTSEDEKIHKVRKTRWASDEPKLELPGSVKLPVGFELDPEIQKLKAELSEIDEKLQKPELHDDRPEHERSPSPEPLYNNLGTRINTWEMRLHQKLVLKRLDITARLFQKTLASEQKHTSSKLCEKLSVPVEEYPGYNFIGLILGPQGNTLKRMERETGARILLRGIGSSLKDLKPSSKKEDLHVRIEAHDKESLDAAVQMVKKLLVPVAEGMNEHKREQLAELARLKKDANGCSVCGEKGHQRYCCPSLQSNFMSMSCDSCGRDSHLTAACPIPIQDNPDKRVYANLYVGHLPQVVDANRLKELFSPFGKLTEAKVIRDQTTGLSKCYGFVKFEDPTDAAAAVTHLNGYKIDGNTIAVRVAQSRSVLGTIPSSVGNPFTPNPGKMVLGPLTLSVRNPFTLNPGKLVSGPLPSSVGNPFTPNPRSASISQINPGHVAWPVPHGSLIPEHQASLTQGEGMSLFQASCHRGNTQLQPKRRGSGLFPAPSVSSIHNLSSTSHLCSENTVPSRSLISEHQASFLQSPDKNLLQASCFGGNTQLQPKYQVLGLTPLGISKFHDPDSSSGLHSDDGVSFSLSSSNGWLPSNPGYGSNSSWFEPYFNKPTLESTPALLPRQTL
ncbi:hypothetical protein V6N13_125635 [Hibiscus sabdariffa]|uniref:Branchpoint-bridging protein n=1 Tax=Hibiscus sabdariffa TaxID=183260 RepID=A0ABR2U672_9ROSI